MSDFITEQEGIVALEWDDLTNEPDSYAIAHFGGLTYFIGFVDEEGDREGLWWAEVVWGPMDNPRHGDLGSEYESREGALGACTMDAAKLDTERRRYLAKLEAWRSLGWRG